MKSGSLRHRITIQQYETARNIYGELEKTWETYQFVWADLQPISGKEYFNSKQHTAEITHKVVARYVEGVTPKMRIFHMDRYFDIEAVINEGERDRQTTMLCREIIL